MERSDFPAGGAGEGRFGAQRVTILRFDEYDVSAEIAKKPCGKRARKAI